MKKLIALAFLLVTTPVYAGGLLDLSGLTELIADKAKETKAASLISVDLDVSGALYLPIYKFHSKAEPNKPSVVYAEAGVGAQLREGGDVRPLLSLGFDIPAMVRRIWSTDWRKSHVTMTKLPPIFVGPYIHVPTTNKVWVIGKEVGVMISISIGGK